jgi:short-subunit dehydrogenase
MKNFENKVVWITGASSGIGEELVHLFAKLDAHVVLSARRLDELVRVKNESLLGESESLLLPFDLADTSNAEELTKKVIEKFGRIDILVNNGGISQRSLAADTNFDVYRQLMEVNFFGNIALTKAVLPYMIKQKSGFIVAVSSLMGKIGFYNRTGYAASKHALHGFYDSLRFELEPYNIKVLIACPSYVKTNISFTALTSDGKPFGKMDVKQAKGTSPIKVAGTILNAIRKNKKEIIFGGKEVIAVYSKYLAPALFSMMARLNKPVK